MIVEVFIKVKVILGKKMCFCESQGYMQTLLVFRIWKPSIDQILTLIGVAMNT